MATTAYIVWDRKAKTVAAGPFTSNADATKAVARATKNDGNKLADRVLDVVTVNVQN